ncbi:hypothetical protein [Olsenella sp. Marseille-P4559]|uniref:hypothetical protein n=1 Tax=Olsenella sp. Marseille-P4559 TaxID=2364795 RepID=UPI001A914627|nr:hypothetical protein [Olsenella sp. Marseille-P4559]
MSDNETPKAPIKGMGSAIDSDAFRNAVQATSSPLNEAMRKAVEQSQISDISSRMSSMLESSGALKSLGDIATKGFKFDMPDAPRLAALDYSMPEYSIPDLSTSMVGYRTDWRQLIIIGNGFDLQCGLKSSFGDFFQPRFEAIKGIPDCKRETWSRLVAESALTL